MTRLVGGDVRLLLTDSEKLFGQESKVTNIC